MVAREARHYLEELRLEEGIRSLVTGHSLEVHVSLSLKPLTGQADPTVRAAARQAPGPGEGEGARRETPRADEERSREG